MRIEDPAELIRAELGSTWPTVDVETSEERSEVRVTPSENTRIQRAKVHGHLEREGFTVVSQPLEHETVRVAIDGRLVDRLLGSRQT